MHKQMLRTSDAVDAMTEGDDRARALDHLYQGQSNDTYWHGLFGGIYISHMRLATYEHLIAAADLAETAAGGLHVAELRDLDLDGHDEVRLAGPGQVVSIDLDEGGAIGGWDIRAVRHNACAVLRRRPEAYHQKLRDHEAAGAAHAERCGPGRTPRPRSTRSSWSRSRVSRRCSTTTRTSAVPDSSDSWRPGPRRRHGRPPKPSSSAMPWTARTRSRRSSSTGSSSGGTRRCRSGRTAPARRSASSRRSRWAATAARPPSTETVEVTNRSDVTVEAILGLEWTLTMLGGGGNPSAWLEIDGERTSHDSPRAATAQTRPGPGQRLHRDRDHQRGLAGRPRSGARRSRRSRTPRPASSASTRARGCSWAGPSHWAGASQTVTVHHAVATSRDHAEEERAAAGEGAVAGPRATGPTAAPRMGPSRG